MVRQQIREKLSLQAEGNGHLNCRYCQENNGPLPLRILWMLQKMQFICSREFN